ncbi:efflux RND transporter permease subunit [Radiobacillus kanasensis]|uniref:efflux RND transporter permease subunit n=1 Tax=Radiobacillus kanasensis TaxID=2844358 RepID=UPI001E4A98D6|nr:efflux RND transporter permease subunit [Radiobacillus kanasensis]UFT99990.1 efflux RND transporter permease subunit [Radiobacillus kanasensis]
MKLLSFIVKRKILVGLSVFLIVLLGGYAILNLDKELMPAVKMDGGYVDITASDMSASEVERTITTPLETDIQSIDGVEEVQSTTSIGRVSLDVTIEEGRGDEVFKEVETVVNSSTAEMSGIEQIDAGQYGATQSYEFFMDVSGSNMEEMTTFAKETLEPRLEALPEVRDVSLSGTLENEVEVAFDREEIQKAQLDVSQVIGMIQEMNSEATLGQFTEDGESSTLRWNSQITEVEDIKDIEIASPTGIISLDRVADITLQPLESSSFVWKNGTKDFIFLQIGRTADVTQIEMAEAVRAEIKNIKDDGLVNGFELNEIVSQADYVQESIDGVTSNIIIGGIIAIVILLLFLRNVRATLIVGISIPTSVLLTFAAMTLFDYSLNILTLIGLGLGIGMMVDSSIVILEAIYRKKEQGMPAFEAVISGVKEVAGAVLASMLTTIVVFLPIGLLGGDMGQMMLMLSTVVALTLISSVIISFTLIPSLSEKFLKLRKPKATSKRGPLLRGYSRLTAWVVKKKRNSFVVITMFVLLFVGSIFLVPKIPMTIMPDMYNRYNEILIQVEPGLSETQKEELINQMHEKLDNIQDVETDYMMDNGNSLYAIINMTKGEDITREQEDVNEEIYESLRDLKEDYPVNSVQGSMSSGGGYPVQLTVKGEEFGDLQALSNEFSDEMAKIDGIVEVQHSMQHTSSQQEIVLNDEALQNARVSPGQIKQLIQQSFLATEIGELTIEEEEVPLKVTWNKESQTENRDALLDMEIPTEDGMKALSSFVSFTNVQTPNEISHSGGERFVTISADIKDRDLGAINRDVQKLIEDYETPNGYDIEAAGDIEQQQELIQEMLMILGIAIFLVYLVMAVQFNHLVHPLIVMSVIPVTVVGVILGLFITNQDLSLMSGMGVVMLIGIVLNNAILLIDRTNQLRQEGYSVEEALLEAGQNRLRPIFMTTLTTVGGMLPLAIASGSAGNYQAPMATAIISGLLFATFITLLLVPAVYKLLSRKRKSAKKDNIEPQEETKKHLAI